MTHATSTAIRATFLGALSAVLLIAAAVLIAAKHDTRPVHEYRSTVKSCSLTAYTRATMDGDGPAWVKDARGKVIARLSHWGDAQTFVDALCSEPH